MRLDAAIIMKAKEGSPYELQYLQEYFDHYITTLSIVYAIEPDGRIVPHLDPDIKEDLRACVIQATLKFDTNKKQKR